MMIEGMGFQFVVKVSFFVVKCVSLDINLQFTDVLCISWKFVTLSHKKSPITTIGLLHENTI